jgi:hypothetical protein
MITAMSEGKSGSANIVVQAAVAGISIPAGQRVVGTGDALTLSATPVDAAGLPLAGRSVQWSSSNTTVATVVADGRVRGVSPGLADITATSEGKSAMVSIAVAFAVSTADFAAPVPGAKPVSGLLHGLNFKNRPAPPPSTLIAPLRPPIWRAIPVVVPTALPPTVGARYELVLSDFWGYPADNWPNGRPYENATAYQNMMRSLARNYRDQVAVWEIWNEPDPRFARDFWDGTEQQFFQTYLAAYRTLRAELGPSALIAGPSITSYQPDYIQRFADFCLANGCELNVLTWHEAGADRPLSTIADHIKGIRRDFVNNPLYAALRIQEIHINESVGPLETYNPAASLTYVQYLELGGADAAARACWGQETGDGGDCFNNSLDGLITPDTWLPRSVWWAYKLYADGASSRVRSTVTDPRVFSLASRTAASSQEAQVLIGVSNVQNGSIPASTVLAVRLTGLNSVPFLLGQAQIRVHLSELPNTDTAALVSPVLVSTQDVSVLGESAEIVVTQAKANAVYVVSLRAIP